MTARRIALALAFAASPALSQDFAADMKMMQLATSLGSVLASESFCGLTYDQTAIAAYISKEVPPDRMDFASMLQVMTMGGEAQQAMMSGSAKTAHCTTTAQTARHFGFTK